MYKKAGGHGVLDGGMNGHEKQFRNSYQTMGHMALAQNSHYIHHALTERGKRDESK
jgi:hypothetical protein